MTCCSTYLTAAQVEAALFSTGVPRSGAVEVCKQSRAVTLQRSEQLFSAQAASFKKGLLSAQTQRVWMS